VPEWLGGARASARSAEGATGDPAAGEVRDLPPARRHIHRILRANSSARGFWFFAKTVGEHDQRHRKGDGRISVFNDVRHALDVLEARLH